VAYLRGDSAASLSADVAKPDTRSPFGSFAPSRGYRRLLRLAQHAPNNALGKQLARAARGLYLWRAPLPADITIGAMKLRCYLRDNTSERKFVFTPWRFDPQERSALSAALPRDGVFVDVGANVGIYTLTAALLLGPAGRIVALEPFPTAFARLKFNIEATRAGQSEWPRIDALQVGISNSEDDRELRIDAGNLGGGSIAAGPARFSQQGPAGTLTIPCKRLSRVLDECGIQRIDVLKIDIEGAEDLALCPFLAEATDERLPRRLIVENSENLWKLDLRAAIKRRGYHALLRTRLNTVYAVPGPLSGRALRR
jgi:FkbM family methyltransferase